MTTSIIGDTLGDVLYRHFKDDSDVLEERVYKLNPHLLKMPVMLPAGTFIKLPENYEKPASEKVKRVVTIWD